MSELSVTWPPRWEESPVTAGGEFVLFDIPRPLARYRVTVTVRREAGGRLPTEDQAMAELALGMVAADGLMGAWSAEESVHVLEVDAADDAAALAAGTLVVKALGGSRGASVSAERVPAPR